MGALTKKQYISVFAAILIVALVYFLPKSSSVQVEEEKVELTNDVDQLELAVVQVLSGKEPPMKGIMEIKELAQNENYKSSATLVLGVFSVMTNQKSKAITRFGEFGSSFSLGERNNAERKIGKVLLKSGNMKEVLSLMQKYKLTSSDDGLSSLLDEIIVEFKNI